MTVNRTLTKLYDMKMTALIFVFILSFLSIMDAQKYSWHYKQCGVIDINNCTSEEFDCLWGEAKMIANVGMIITIVGTSSIVIGGYLFNGYWGGDDQSIVYYGMMVITGLIAIPVGITVWITGANRKSELRKTPNYDTFMLGSLKVSPSIGVDQFNNTYNYGVTLSLTF